MSVGSGFTSMPAHQLPQASPDLPSSTPSTPHTSSHMPHAITSQDGTITINIRQPDRTSLRPSTQHTSITPSRPHPPPTYSSRTHHVRGGSGVRDPRSVREVFYSSDPNEEFVDSERVSVFMDKKDLKKNYERAVYHGG